MTLNWGLSGGTLPRSLPSSRFDTSPDWLKVTHPGVGTNRYAYSLNDPINLFDPSGNDILGLEVHNPINPIELGGGRRIGGDQAFPLGPAIGLTATILGSSILEGDISNRDIGLPGEIEIGAKDPTLVQPNSSVEALSKTRVRVQELEETPEGSIPLFRAVGPDEAASLLASGGIFLPSPYGSEGKYFALEPAGAAIEGGLLHKNGFVVVATTAPVYAINKDDFFHDASPEGPIHSVVVRNPQLPLLTPAIPIMVDGK